MKVCSVYNICGLSGRENTDYYIQSIQSILDQNFDDFKVVVSSCLSSEDTIAKLKDHFDTKININWIHDKVPVNVSFNHSVLQAIQDYGSFDSYLYIDSGCNLIGKPNVLKDLYDLHTSGPYGMTVGRTNTDTGFPVWLNIGSHDNDSEGFDEFFKQHGHFIVPVGRAVNHHFQLWDRSIQEAFGKLWPDIFAGQCSESVFSFLNASLKKKWVIHSDVVVEHRTGLDVPSVGFSPPQWAMSGKQTYNHPFIIPDVLDRLLPGQQYGLGYEENRPIIAHDISLFDEDGFALNENLLPFIKNNLYLRKEELDYDSIQYWWF